MSFVLGIDTSNYTTSAALYDTNSGEVVQSKKLLPVKSGDCGIRQSDAVFHHTRQLPEVMGNLPFEGKKIDAVAVSCTPREAEGSYMPCFLAGVSVAKSLSTVLGVPLFEFSHQQGHIAAAVYGSKRAEEFDKEFLAFHISGGTTEALWVTPDSKGVYHAKLVAQTLDLNAGQLIDRIGVMMGLDFPCGVELEKLAAVNTKKIKIKPTLKGTDCCLSGFENKLSALYKETGDKPYVAAATLSAISSTLIEMTNKLLEKYGNSKLLYSGGVMSDYIIQEEIKRNFTNASFAPPQFSADNAVGIAVLGAKALMNL